MCPHGSFQECSLFCLLLPLRSFLLYCLYLCNLFLPCLQTGAPQVAQAGVHTAAVAAAVATAGTSSSWRSSYSSYPSTYTISYRSGYSSGYGSGSYLLSGVGGGGAGGRYRRHLVRRRLKGRHGGRLPQKEGQQLPCRCVPLGAMQQSSEHS